MGTFVRSAVFALAVCASAPAMAQNIVQNGGFETGNFASWTIGNPTQYTQVVNIAGLPSIGSGNYVAAFGTIGSESSLSQNLATTAGTNYTISFTLLNNGGSPNSFSASFGSNILTSLVDAGSFGLTNYTFTSDAASASTALTFAFRQDPSYYYIDSISVVANAASAAPEPATWAFMILGFGVAGATLRRSRKTALVAYA